MLIGDLATQAGLSAKAIRFYEQAGLLPQPPRTSGGYRDYPLGAVDRLAFIRHAQAAGFTLADIRSVLTIRDSGQAPCQHVADVGQGEPGRLRVPDEGQPVCGTGRIVPVTARGARRLRQQPGLLVEPDRLGGQASPGGQVTDQHDRQVTA